MVSYGQPTRPERVSAVVSPALAAAFTGAADRLRVAGVMDFAGQNPWDRLPTPSDYVGPLVFLASDDAGLMTGGNITVDGGALAKYWPQTPRRATARAAT